MNIICEEIKDLMISILNKNPNASYQQIQNEFFELSSGLKTDEIFLDISPIIYNIVITEQKIKEKTEY